MISTPSRRYRWACDWAWTTPHDIDVRVDRIELSDEVRVTLTGPGPEYARAVVSLRRTIGTRRLAEALLDAAARMLGADTSTNYDPDPFGLAEAAERFERGVTEVVG